MSKKDIVDIEGRKPYNKAVPRLAANGYEQRQPDPSYVSWQSKINTGPKGTINEKVLESYLKSSGYEEVDPEDIDRISSGARIAYITKTNKWRSAGWLSRVEESETDADGNEFEDGPRKYVLYKSYNNACFPVQVDDVEMFYVMVPKIEPVVAKMIYFKRPVRVTNFPIMLENSEGEEVIVAYARDSYNQKKFMKTDKYKNAKNDPESWAFEDTEDQEPNI
jgi:hypothetical protein